jgi:hypothetical protein
VEPKDSYAFLRAWLGALGPGGSGSPAVRMPDDFETADASFWEKVVKETDYHGVTLLAEPAVATLSKTRPAVIPDHARRTFFALASHHRQIAAARETCVDRLLTTFAAAGITMILLKGAALAHRIYPSPELRPMVDIDILIDPAQARAAVKAASELGYRFEPRHSSRFAGRLHHIPVAEITESGFRIFLEIHIDAMHLDQPYRLVLSNLASKPLPFKRGSGPEGLALGHIDMLHHLAVHTFDWAHRVRLIHLYDLWRYQAIFHDEIDWRQLETRFPQVVVVLHLVSQFFTGSVSEPVPAGLGLAMIPLAEIASSDRSLGGKIAAVFNPPAWWLHGFYGVPPERSLLLCRTVRHPIMVGRWLLARGSGLLGLRGNWNWVESYNRNQGSETES